MPQLGKIMRTGGLAGQFAYTVEVTYPGEAPKVVWFVGTAYGPSVVMCTPDSPGGERVADPERFGPALTPEWVRAFFA
jgi:hypothetical protein